MATDKLAKQVSEIEAAFSKLPPEAVDGFINRLKRHSYSVRLDAHHAVRYSVMGASSSCSKAWLVVTCGRDTTDSKGKVVVPLGKLLCGAEGDAAGHFYVAVGEPMVVVSAHGGAPAIVTSNTRATSVATIASLFLRGVDGDELISGNYLQDLEVEIQSWGVDGKAAAGVNVSWICTFEAMQLYVAGG